MEQDVTKQEANPPEVVCTLLHPKGVLVAGEHRVVARYEPGEIGHRSYALELNIGPDAMGQPAWQRIDRMHPDKPEARAGLLLGAATSLMRALHNAGKRLVELDQQLRQLRAENERLLKANQELYAASRKGGPPEKPSIGDLWLHKDNGGWLEWEVADYFEEKDGCVMRIRQGTSERTAIYKQMREDATQPNGAWRFLRSTSTATLSEAAELVKLDNQQHSVASNARVTKGTLILPLSPEPPQTHRLVGLSESTPLMWRWEALGHLPWETHCPYARKAGDEMTLYADGTLLPRGADAGTLTPVAQLVLDEPPVPVFRHVPGKGDVWCWSLSYHHLTEGEQALRVTKAT